MQEEEWEDLESASEDQEEDDEEGEQFEDDEPDDADDDTSSKEDNNIVPIDDPKFGCKHYRRRCQKRCNTCLEFFTCRLCHDEVKHYNERDPKKNH